MMRRLAPPIISDKFVLHFLDAHSIPQALLSENCCFGIGILEILVAWS